MSIFYWIHCIRFFALFSSFADKHVFFFFKMLILQSWEICIFLMQLRGNPITCVPELHSRALTERCLELTNMSNNLHLCAWFNFGMRIWVISLSTFESFTHTRQDSFSTQLELNNMLAVVLMEWTWWIWVKTTATTPPTKPNKAGAVWLFCRQMYNPELRYCYGDAF